MEAFFDTSAAVALALKEPDSSSALKAWDSASTRIAWQWLRVEAEAALLRRKSPSEAWTLWRTIEGGFNWIEPEGDWLQDLRTFNRGAALRAADAGHLYVFERCILSGMHDLTLVTFDREMSKAAQRRGLAVWRG